MFDVGLDDSMDRTWQSYLDGLEGQERSLARRALRSLRLAPEREPAWDEFVRHAPNRSLPRFGVPDHALHLADEPTLQRFVRAHHHAAFFWIVSDRVADRQLARTEDVVALRQMLLRSWALALAEAVGEPVAARRAIARDLAAWRRGVALDRALFARGRMTPAEYRRSVGLRLRCVATCTRALLEARSLRGDAAALVRVSDLFMMACQCRDDALDVAEDRATRGASVPDLLGLVPGALVRAAARLAGGASREAARAGFSAYAAWLDRFAREANVGLQGSDGAAQVFGALALMDGMRQVDGGIT